MRVTVRLGTALEPTLTELAQRRFAFALGRFGGSVRSLTVRLRDLNGPRGGHDKLCAVAVRLAGVRREIVVEETSASALMAIDGAANRMARAVARAVDAHHDWRTSRLRAAR